MTVPGSENVEGGGRADHASEIDLCGGPAAPPRHIDPVTTQLGYLAKTFDDVQRVRKAAHLREARLLGSTELAGVSVAELFAEDEKVLARLLGKALKQHVLWDWLEPLKGLAGPLTARAISIIGDPLRFPGQKCTMGHTLPPFYDVGAPCPITAVVPGEDDGVSDLADSSREVEVGPVQAEEPGETEFPDGSDKQEVPCIGTMLQPRRGTGVKALNHYAGLHVVDGKLPMRRRGVQADWNPTLRTLALQPQGLAEQIIRHRTPGYREIYDEAKARGKYHNVARTIAVKEFLGDLLIEWKRRVQPDVTFEGSQSTYRTPT